MCRKQFCYTFQLKYVFWLEEDMSHVMGENSLTPQRNDNLNIWLKCNQVMLLETPANLCASLNQIIFAQFVLILSWEVWQNTLKWLAPWETESFDAPRP